MKLSVSNIAWDKSKNLFALEILKSVGIHNIDIAPTLCLDSFVEEDVIKLKIQNEKNGINVVGVQSLLYPYPNITLFENRESKRILLEHLEKNFKISNILGVHNLVFGSPKNRFIKNGDTYKDGDYVEIFREISDLASFYDCIICFEPNPSQYGCNFITNTLEAIEFIKEVDHNSFKLNLDTSTTIINNEDFDEILFKNLDLVQHIHISSPGIKGITDIDNKYFSESIKNSNYDKFVTMECLFPNDDNLENLKSNIICFKNNYYKN